MFGPCRQESGRANAIIAATSLDTAPADWPEEWPDQRLANLREVMLQVITETAGLDMSPPVPAADHLALDGTVTVIFPGRLKAIHTGGALDGHGPDIVVGPDSGELAELAAAGIRR